MYIQSYAYYCDFGSDADRCLSSDRPLRREGLTLARERLGSSRMVAVTPRSAIFGAAAVMRCLELRERAPGVHALEDLPIFFACGTGLGAPAIYAASLTTVGCGEEFESAIFSSAGPQVSQTVRYAAALLGGAIAQFSGIKGENRSLTGTAAGALALRQAERFLASGRASEAIVVCGESLVEWAAERLSAVGRAGPSEIGCAFHLSSRRAPGLDALFVAWEGTDSEILEAPPFTYFEAANAPANLCWALEQLRGGSRMFRETDRRGRTWTYGIRATRGSGA